MNLKKILLLLLIPYCCYATDSPFDVLNSDDRYKSEDAKEFDINEGGEEATTEAVPTPRDASRDIFDLIDRTDQAGSYYNIAKIVALNKITAKSQQLSIKVGETAYFGNIAISVNKCWNNNDPYLAQSKILLKVVESRVDEDPQNIFLGWLISGNMSVATLEHPSYELIAIECSNGK